MPIRKVMKGIPVEHLAAEGLMKHDHEALTAWQRECTTRTSMTIQLEHEAYLSQHPEIIAMMELFVSTQASKMKRSVNVIKEAGEFFLQPFEDLDNIIRKRLGVEPGEPYVKTNRKTFDIHDEENLELDLKAIVAKHNPPKTWSLTTPSESLRITESSSFLSFMTSDTTLPTPEPTPIPTPTLSQHFMTLVSNTIDKAIYTRFDDQAVYYDTAYVMVRKAVETAMEIPVADIKEDVIELYKQAYAMFEAVIDEKKMIAAGIAWEKRMRKKMKRTLRRQKNFKGYESPPSSRSSISSHESYRHAPPRPCACHPQYHYNRYPKDRFGIYLPTEPKAPDENATVTPVISVESLVEEHGEGFEEDLEAKSSKSSATHVSKSSKASKHSKKTGGVQFKTES